VELVVLPPAGLADVRDPGSVDVLPFRGKQRGAGAGVVVVELARTSSMNHRRVGSAPLISGTIRSLGPELRAPLPWRTWSLPKQGPLHDRVLSGFIR
jgi:hypothetical protein